ncbi:MAG: hypothetical protein K0Q55_3254 [Verrucomicrobia bacterium]|nr:hypothetical protein [Verrucomicrobiota bacterium]
MNSTPAASTSLRSKQCESEAAATQPFRRSRADFTSVVKMASSFGLARQPSHDALARHASKHRGSNPRNESMNFYYVYLLESEDGEEHF